jgi:hypothetical protein
MQIGIYFVELIQQFIVVFLVKDKLEFSPLPLLALFIE